ncbi:MAG: glycoside hydrolase family 65 protein [Planctomycetes bacterium]|nr:glycoside hydrolase family 65 protein [Planctomycetota bacterium]
MKTDESTWSLVETSFNPRLNRHYEGLFALGSGPLQQRAALEEGLPDAPQNTEYVRLMQDVTAEKFPDLKSRVGTYLPGVSGPHPTCQDELINLPALHGLILFANEERLDMQAAQLDEYRRQLDLRTARLERTLVWRTRAGAVLRVSFARFISAHRRHIMALRCRVAHIGGSPAELRIISTLDADVRTNGFDHFERVEPSVTDETLVVAVHTNGGDEVVAAALACADAVLSWSPKTNARQAFAECEYPLRRGAALELCKYSALTSTRQTATPRSAASEHVRAAAEAGFDRLAAESDEIWQRRWAASDVVIEGDPRSQLAMRTALYHLLRAVVEDDPRCSIDAKAAAGEAYCGRYFWDSDVFMLPVFLYTRPAVGRTLARFRLKTLDGARRNARRCGYPGARYAWESSPAGDENCPCWQCANHELHITADVAYGLWHAYRAGPQDAEFLAGIAEVLSETARYWCERAYFNPERNEYELLMVMGPDEYTAFSRNNAYTNHLVALALSLTTQAWQQLGKLDAAATATLRDRLMLTDEELAHFATVAARLRFPYDGARRLVLQSDDFFDYEPFDFERWWPRRAEPLGHSVPLERLYRSQVLKQADVIQLLVLFPHQFDLEQMRVAYETYVPLTTHDSSLSRAMHAIVAAWIGRSAEALRLWRDSAETDLRPGAAAEGIHAACAGGTWQAVVFGFAGLRTRMQSELLQLDPHLPPGWTALRFPFVWCGQPLYIQVESGAVTIEHRGKSPVVAHVRTQESELQPGQTHTFPL